MKTYSLRTGMLICLMAFLFANVGDLLAQPVLKNKTKRILRRTTLVLLVTHKKVKEGKVYTGNLAKGIAHQRFARKLFYRGRYYRAIHHSRRARRLAFMALKANKVTIKKEWEIEGGDGANMKASPNDSALDAVLAKEMPGQVLKDEDIIGKPLNDIDISDTSPGDYKGR